MLVRRQIMDGLHARHATHGVAPYIGVPQESTFGQSASYASLPEKATKSLSVAFAFFV